MRIQTSPELRVLDREVLFPMPDGTFGLRSTTGINLDISPDGQRFLVARAAEGDDEADAPRVVVVLNWIEELKRVLEIQRAAW